MTTKKKKVVKKKKATKKFVPVVKKVQNYHVETKKGHVWKITHGDKGSAEVSAPCSGTVTVYKEEYVALRAALNEIFGVA